HPVLGTAMMGGHYRHTARKAAKHLPKKHRIKWHDSLLAIAAYYLPRTAYRCCVRLVAPLVWRGGLALPSSGRMRALARTSTSHSVQQGISPGQDSDENRIRDE